MRQVDLLFTTAVMAFTTAVMAFTTAVMAFTTAVVAMRSMNNGQERPSRSRHAQPIERAASSCLTPRHITSGAGHALRKSPPPDARLR